MKPLEPQSESLTKAKILSEISETLQDIRDRASAAKDRRRRDLLSALDSLARLSKTQLSTIQSDPNSLRAALGNLPLGESHVSRKRLQNIKSDVQAAIRLYGIPRATILKRIPLSSEWAALLDHIGDKERRYGLLRLARFGSAYCISPSTLTIPSLLDLYELTKSESVLKNPKRTVNQTICAWNWCVRHVEKWPKQRLGSPFKSETLIRRIGEFPAGFQRDISRWRERVSDKGTLEFEGPVRKLRSVTVAHHTKTILRFASLLVAKEIVAIERLKSLSVIVDPQIVKAGLVAMRDRDCGVSYLRSTAVVLLTIARRECQRPDTEIKILSGYVSRLERHRGMTSKNLELLATFENLAKVRALFAVADKLRRAASRLVSSVRRALAYETALFIDILLWSQLRMQNMRTLRLDQIRWERGICVLSIQGHEMKNNRSFETELPEHVGRHLKTFIEVHRRQLPGASGPFLFPAADGRAKHVTTLTNNFQRATIKHAGFKINPHFARHLGATLLLDGDPTRLPLVSQKLGHATMETAKSCYLPSQSRNASRINNRLLEERLQGPAKGSKA